MELLVYPGRHSDHALAPWATMERVLELKIDMVMVWGGALAPWATMERVLELKIDMVMVWGLGLAPWATMERVLERW